MKNIMTIRRTGSTLVGMALAFILFCHAAAVSAQIADVSCWTMVGSGGTVDEADLDIVALGPNTVAVSSTVTNATVDLRYNVVAVDGVYGGQFKTLTARFADNGAAARVIVHLTRLNIFTGVFTTLAELDSNNFAPSTVAQTREVALSQARTCDGSPEFDFLHHIYYVEVQLIKTGAGGNPLIRAIQICGGGVC
jgi:hypothetical protein